MKQAISPTAFNDKLVGSDDVDTFTALAGDDEIYGFGGNDQIIAGTGNDTIYGGDGDDNIQPGAGDDKIYGEGGNDTIYLSAGADIEDGGEGTDTIIFGPDQTTLPVTINLDTGRYHFTSQIVSITQNLISIENITSEGGADLTIYDTSGVNVITTNTGNDTIHSKGGNDTITTGSGNTVYLGDGTYTVDLGAGNDTVYLTTTASSIDGNTGTDEAVARAFDGFVVAYIDLQFSTYFVPSKLSAQDGMEVSLQNFEKVTIDGNVASTLLGTAAADTLTGATLVLTQLLEEAALILLQVVLALTNLFSPQVIRASRRQQLTQLLIFPQEPIKLILLQWVAMLKQTVQALAI